MKKITRIAGTLLLAFPISLMTSNTFAHDGSSEFCDFNLDYDLKVNDSNISFIKASKTEVRINQDNNLYINGNEKSLTNEQQQLLDQYADGVRDLIPEVTAIALEGINIGVEAATLALGTLLGEGDADFVRFSDKITELAETISVKLDATNFDSQAVEEAFDNEFEQQIETIVEEAITELTPRIMAKIVTAAMSGNEGEISDLERRAESIEGDISQIVEPRAEALEARAEELCDSVVRLDDIENKLVATGLTEMNLIDKDIL